MTRVIVAAFPYSPIAAAPTHAIPKFYSDAGVSVTLTVRCRVCNGVDVTVPRGTGFDALGRW
jgi:hypothetical protein